MKFARLMFREAGEGRHWLILSSTIPGLAMGVMIAVVNAASGISDDGRKMQLLGLFIAACAANQYMMGYAFRTTTRLTQQVVNRTRVRFAEKIRNLSLASFEEIGQSRISTALSRDLQTLSEATSMVVTVMASTLMLTAAALYVAYLSYAAFAVTIVIVGAAIYFYKRSQATSRPAWQDATRAEEGFFKALGHLLGGFKETKMNFARGDDLLNNYIVPASRNVAELKIEADRRFNAGGRVTTVFFHTLIGIMVFALPNYLESGPVSGRIVMTIVFVSGALEGIIEGLPLLAKADVAVDNLRRLERELSAAARDSRDALLGRPPAALVDSISLQGVAYSYVDADGSTSFTVGPSDLTISAGTITFIVGGNGSGKSTLLKLLVKLYEPARGVFVWDGQDVTEHNAHKYRSLFTVIFSDFHLFDRLYGMDEVETGQIDTLLKEMELHDKVSFAGGKFSTTELSTGQRKRLAMMVARLENRPVYVFDEWAADQDPEFRRYYYEVLLRGLKAQGHTVVAITHDDRYFNVADRVVFMEEGRVTRIEDKP